jgi:lysine-N-methylase
MLYKKIEGLDKADNVEGIPAMFEAFANEIENEEFGSELDKIENSSEMQMILAKMLTDKQLGASLTDAGRYLQCVVETLAGLQIVEGGSIEDSLKIYIENRDTYLAEYLKDKEYVLENFLVNEFFIQLMPFETSETIWNSYLSLCVTYSIIKLHLNGMAGCHKGLDDKTVFRLIQAFSKVTQHNKSLVQNVVQQLKDVERDTLAWMTILING